MKLSFTDLTQGTQLNKQKVFVFDSSDVKLSIKYLLPSDNQLLTTSSFDVQVLSKSNHEPTNKKPKLLDFCSVSNLDQSLTVNTVDAVLTLIIGGGTGGLGGL